jgi:hypothetical protein
LCGALTLLALPSLPPREITAISQAREITQQVLEVAVLFFKIIIVIMIIFKFYFDYDYDYDDDLFVRMC